MRTCGHVGPEDDDKEYNYRKKDLDKWKGKDPVKWLRKELLKNNQEKNIFKIEKTNKALLEKALKKARSEDFLSYRKSLKFNFIKSYSKLVKKFSKPKINFGHEQKITKLNPYWEINENKKN